MTDVAIKRAASLPGAAVREKLRTLDDSAVVTAFLGGEERAFQELVERYQTRLLNFVFRTIGDREKAEDLVQDAWVAAMEHWSADGLPDNPAAWLTTTVRNRAIDALRHQLGMLDIGRLRLDHRFRICS